MRRLAPRSSGLCVMHLLIGLVLAASVLPSPAALASAGAAPTDLDAGWEYRWGDSPFDATGVPIWTRTDADTKSWHPIAFPSNPPGRNGQRNVWYRIRIPERIYRDPVIYIFSVDLITEVYLDGRQLYHFGSFDEHGRGHFEGWPWHMITLPADFQGKTIYFRIYSDYKDIGLWGEVKLMERLELIQYIFKSSQANVIASLLSFLIAVVSLMFSLVSSERRPYLPIALLTLATGLMVLAGSQAKQFLFNAPLIWNHIDAAAYFSVPVAMALLFRDWCGRPWTPVINGLGGLHALYMVGAVGGSVMGFVALSTTYPVFDVLLTISLSILFASAFAHLRRVTADQKVAMAAFALLSLILLIDMGVAHGLLPWTRMPIPWGVLVFSLILIVLALRHFARTQRDLKDLNVTLEQKVRERTRDLERSNADLKQFAYVISHDLQEPLRMVVSYMQLLQRRHADRLDASGHEYIAFAVGGAKRMSDMILGLLEFSRIDTRAQAFQTVSLAEATDDVLRNLDVLVQTSGAIVRLGDLPAVRADPSQIRSLLQNLIGNALKYRAPDRTPVIRVDVKDGGDAHAGPDGAHAPGNDDRAPPPMVTVVVSDNGIGIDPAFHKRVFRVFERLHGPHQYGGTGIGLAVCKRIVDRHDGRIWIESEPGVGTTVRFTLPAAEE